MSNELNNLFTSTNFQEGGGKKVLKQAVAEIPDAAVELAQEAYAKPWETAKHVITTAGGAAVMGTALGAIIPARGPVAAITGIAFSIPIVVSTYHSIRDAYKAGNRPGANIDGLAHGLARDTVMGAVDMGLGFAGGYAGSEAGRLIATSNTRAGSLFQSLQRGILRGENKTLTALAHLKTAATETPVMQTRLAQFMAPKQEFEIYVGSLHGHSRYSDGMGLPKDIYAKASKDMDFYAITDHNHKASRGGVSPKDPRAKDQAGTPNVAETPIHYSQTFADAKAATKDGEFVGLVGVEMGTIGPDPHTRLPKGLIDSSQPHGHSHGHSSGHTHESLPIGKEGAGALPEAEFIMGTNVRIPKVSGRNPTAREQALLDAAARDVSHYSGVNHINLFEVPTFFESVKQPKPKGFAEMFRRALGLKSPEVVQPPNVVKYNDGDYKAMIRHLSQLKDTEGGTPIIQLNHPRYLADENPALPAAVRGRDYGVKSFSSIKEWQQEFGRHASLIEVITGEAMNPNPVPVIKSKDMNPVNLAGYIDKGLHLGPTYGRDDHFALPGGRPAGTGLIAKNLDRGSLLDAMRNRRTMATSNAQELRGYMTGNDAYPMGTILDQAAVQDLGIKMHLSGNIRPDAEYKLQLWGDTKIGDKKLAQVVQSADVTGQQLLQQNGVFKFDDVHHLIGNKSAWYVEVQRKDPLSGNTDFMWTAPIWIEPLAGQHSALTRALVGSGSVFAQ